MRFFPDAAGRVLSVTVGQHNPHLWSAWPQFGVTLLRRVLLGGRCLPVRKRGRLTRMSPVSGAGHDRGRPR